jgi:hypothetical protein
LPIFCNKLKVFHHWGWDAIELVVEFLVGEILELREVLDLLLLDGSLDQGELLHCLFSPSLHVDEVSSISLVLDELDWLVKPEAN